MKTRHRVIMLSSHGAPRAGSRSVAFWACNCSCTNTLGINRQPGGQSARAIARRRVRSGDRVTENIALGRPCGRSTRDHRRGRRADRECECRRADASDAARRERDRGRATHGGRAADDARAGVDRQAARQARRTESRGRIIRRDRVAENITEWSRDRRRAGDDR